MSQINTNLKFRTRAWAGQLTRLAKSFAPAHVAPAISSHVEDNGDGNFVIHITADRMKAPDARAWEFGSGIHSKKGVKEKYPILPKNKKILAFYWDVADENPDEFSFLKDGRVALKSVKHPGIEAANGGQGYITPAIKELRLRAKEELDEDIRTAITQDIRRSFGAKPT